MNPSSEVSNIELGTLSHPFKALDDPFREAVTVLSHLDPSLVIYLEVDSNLTMHTFQMALVLLNSDIHIR